MHFIVQMDKDGTTMATLSQIKPTLALLEKLAGKQGSSFTDTVDILLNAAKRRAAESKPIIQKAGQLSEDTLLYRGCILCTICLTRGETRWRIQ
jgi:hypothetical protein